MDISFQEFTIDRRLYRQALRELITIHPEEHIFDSSLAQEFSSQGEGNSIVVRKPHCHFEVRLVEDTAIFTNYHGNIRYFMEIMAKYVEPVEKSFEVYLGAPEVLMAQTHRKPKTGRSQPSFFRASSLPSGELRVAPGILRKKSLCLLGRIDGGADLDDASIYDIHSIRASYVHSVEHYEIFTKIFILHALIDLEVHKDLEEAEPEISAEDMVFLERAKKYYQASQKGTQATRSSSKKAPSSPQRKTRDLLCPW